MLFRSAPEEVVAEAAPAASQVEVQPVAQAEVAASETPAQTSEESPAE